MRRARQRLSRYHRLDPPFPFVGGKIERALVDVSGDHPNHRTAFIRMRPRLWHADLGPLWDHTLCAMPNDLLFRERLKRSQTADCRHRPARMRYGYFLGVKWSQGQDCREAGVVGLCASTYDDTAHRPDRKLRHAAATAR
jgi:hypothetical protein